MAVRSRSILLAQSLTAAAACALFAAGCGGGGGTHSTAPSGGGTSAATSGYTQGAITAFGTIHLGSGADEKIFHVEHATLKRLDDGIEHQGLDDDGVMFRVGMKVEIFHDADSTEAREVRFMDDLEGPITAKPSTHAGATFDVLGLPVLVDANTHFDDSMESTGLTLGGLSVGNVIELSGDRDGNGVFHATFIEAKRVSAAGRTFEVKGDVAGLSGSAPNQSFTVNGVTFNMSSTSETRDLAVGLANGLFVEVKTTSTTAPFIVTRIEGLGGDMDEPENEVRGAEEASMEGFITNLTGSSPNFSFTLGDTHVTTSSATTGLNLIHANAHVEAEGPVGASGEIKATRIETRP